MQYLRSENTDLATARYNNNYSGNYVKTLAPMAQQQHQRHTNAPVFSRIFSAYSERHYDTKTYVVVSGNFHQFQLFGPTLVQQLTVYLRQFLPPDAKGVQTTFSITDYQLGGDDDDTGDDDLSHLVLKFTRSVDAQRFVDCLNAAHKDDEDLPISAAVRPISNQRLDTQTHPTQHIHSGLHLGLEAALHAAGADHLRALPGRWLCAEPVDV